MTLERKNKSNPKCTISHASAGTRCSDMGWPEKLDALCRPVIQDINNNRIEIDTDVMRRGSDEELAI